MSDGVGQPTEASDASPEILAAAGGRDLLEGLQRGSSAGLRELLTFLRPFVAPSAAALAVAVCLGLLSLLAAAGIPLVLESLLNGSFTSQTILLIVALMGVDVLTNAGSRRASYEVAAATGQRVSEFVFGKTLGSPVLRQLGMRRPSVISRHTSDVDRIEEALDQSLTEGLPAIAQILLSLSLLFYVEPKAGVPMAVGILVFLVVNRSIGRRVLGMDKARLDASSDIGALVDESITASRAVTGMNLSAWMRERFAARASVLRLATLAQRGAATRIFISAKVAGYIALAGVALLAFALGSAEAGSIAAALLYINSIVTGLERVPGWLRNARLAVTSKRRIEAITAGPPLVDRDVALGASEGARGLSLVDLEVPGLSLALRGRVDIPAGSLVGVVLPPGVPATDLLETATGDVEPGGGAVLLHGADVRHPEVKRRVCLLSVEPYLMDASALAHLRAADPYLVPERAREVLAEVGLAHLAELPGGGIEAPLGTAAGRLSVHERQRLMVAMAVAGSTDAVVIDDLPIMGDVDVALPLLAALRARGRTVVVVTRSAEFARRCDLVLAALDGVLVADTHARLLADDAYAAIWHSMLAGVDDRVLEALPEEQREHVRSRLVTERYHAGETIFRAGSPADRVVFVTTGRVAILGEGPDGSERRVATVGPGNFVGEVSSPGARHAHTVRATEDTTVRTISAEAWTAGLMGVLDASAEERRVLVAVLRSDHPDEGQVLSAMPDVSPEDARAAVHSLVESGRMRRDADGRLSVVGRRRHSTAAAALLDRLA